MKQLICLTILTLCLVGLVHADSTQVTIPNEKPVFRPTIPEDNPGSEVPPNVSIPNEKPDWGPKIPEKPTNSALKAYMTVPNIGPTIPEENTGCRHENARMQRYKRRN
jgi:hypothetical protein